MAKLTQIFEQPNGTTWAIVKDKQTTLYLNMPTIFFGPTCPPKDWTQPKLNDALDQLSSVPAIQCAINAKSAVLQARKLKKLIPLTWLNRNEFMFQESPYTVEANAVYHACKLLNIKDFLRIQYNKQHSFLLLTNPHDRTVKILIDLYKNK